MAITAPSWFDESVYMANKLKQLRTTEPAANWTEESMAQAFVAAGYGAGNVYQHFLDSGEAEDVSPVAEFNVTEYYTAKAIEFFKLPAGTMPTALQYETIKDTIHKVYPEGGAWEHYQRHGLEEGLNPSNAFDAGAYMLAKLALMQATTPTYTMADLEADFEAAGYSPMGHYLTYKGQTGEVAADINFEVPADEQVTPPAGTGTTGQTFTLTDKVDVLTGTANDDTFIAGAGTIQAGDTLNGGDGNDTLKIYAGQTTSNLITTSVENVILNGFADNTAIASDFAGMTGVQNIVIDGSTATAGVALNNLGDDVTVTLKGTVTGLTTGARLTLDFDTTGGIALDNMIGDSTGTFIDVSDTLTELTVSGTSAMTAAGTPRAGLSLNGTATSSLETLVVNADANGFISMDVNTAFAKLAVIDASGSKGQTRFDITNVTSTDLAVTGGTGDDTLRLNAAQLANVTFDGGLGHDRAVVANVGALAAATYAAINKLGVEEVIFENVAGSIDAGQLTAKYIGVEDDLTVNNIAADDFIVHTREDGSGIGSTGVVLNTVVGNDVVNLILENSLTAAASANGIAVASASSFKILNITGDGTQALTYDGSSTTRGDLTINGKDYAGVMTITGGAGDDTIIAGTGGSTITGSAGNDKITLGAGADNVVFSAAATNGIDTINGFTAGAAGDVLNVKALGTITAEAAFLTQLTTKVSFAATTANLVATDGAAGSLFQGGKAVVTDFADATQMAAYLNEAFDGTNSGKNVFVVNDTTNDKVYVYAFADVNSDAVIDAADLTLVGVAAANDNLTLDNISFA